MSGLSKSAQKYYQTFSGTDTLVYLIMTKGSKATVLGALSTISYSSYRAKRPVNVLGQIVSKSHTFGTRTIGGTLIFSVINSNFVEELLINNSWLRNHGHLKADELPLFDLMIVTGNEYGAYSQAFISGVSIVDEGQVISVEDMFSENTFSFIAKDFIPFSDFNRNNNDPMDPTTVKDGGIKIPNTTVNKPVYDTIWLNGSLVKLVYGYIIKKDGRNFVPLRDMFDALGWPVWWEDEKDIARIKIGEHYMDVDPITGNVSGNYLTEILKKKPFTMTTKPFLQNTGTGTRTYIPVGIFFPEIGYNVTYEESTRKVLITGKQASGGANEDLTIKEIQEHLNRHGQKGTPVAITGIMDAKTKEALKNLCMAYGFNPAVAISSDFKILNEDLKVALTRPTAGYILKSPEIKVSKKKEAIIIYANNSTSARKVKTVEAKTSFTISAKMTNWMKISKPIIGFVEARVFE